MKAFVKQLVPSILVRCYHYTIALAGAVIFRFPSRRLIVIGVTGTNGKSTVVYCIARLLQDAGCKVAVSSTIEFQIGERRWPNAYKMTMPGRFFLQNFLRQAVDAGCSHAVIEVTSEGILQSRHRFIDWDIAVFLNLSPEHIERHGGYEQYREAKAQLFASLKSARPDLAKSKYSQGRTSIVNLADKEAGYFLQFPADRYFGFRLSNQEATARLPQGGQEIIGEGDRISSMFAVRGVQFRSSLLGDFNIENWLAAISVGMSLGLPPERMAQAVSRVSVIPGRLEEIPNDCGIRVFVDYAHTPVALENVYRTLKRMGGDPPSAHRLICVLGAAGGGRDKWKRPELGRIAATHCDHVILTNEDPYDENPDQILSEIESGMANAQISIVNCEKILDRREAIKRAVALAQPGDTVIITGKGCEPWIMATGGRKIAWDDREVAREILAATEKER